MDKEFWCWAKTKKQAKEQRKMFIQYGNRSWFITILVLLISWPVGLFSILISLCFYGAAFSNYIHEKLVLDKKETSS